MDNHQRPRDYDPVQEDPPIRNMIPHAWVLLRVLRRRWRLACVSMFILMAVGSTWLITRQPLFQARAQLTIERGRRTVEFTANPLANVSGQEYNLLNTQKDLLLSQVVLDQAIAASPLRTNPTYAASNDPVKVLRTRLEIQLPPTSWVITLGLSDEDPRRAEDGLRAVIDAFFAQQQRLEQERSEHSLGFLKRQVAEARRSVDLARAEEEDYRREQQLFAVDVEKSFSTQKLTTLTGKLVVLKEQAAALKVLLDQIEATNQKPAEEQTAAYLAFEVINRHPLVVDAQKALSDLRTKRDELSRKYLERHPRMIELNEQLAGRTKILNEAIATVLGSVRSEYTKLTGQTVGITTRIKDEEEENNRYRNGLSHLQTLVSRTQSMSNRYDLLLKRLNEEEVYSRTDQAQVLLADPPHASSSANFSRSLILALLMLMSIGGGIIIAILAEVLDQRLHWDAGQDQIAGVRVLGTLQGTVSTTVHEALADDLRRLRTNTLMALSGHTQPQIIAVIAPGTGDGATTMSLGLAHAFANAGERVLLVDGDLRSAGLTYLLGESTFPDSQAPRLAELLAGEPGVAPTVELRDGLMCMAARSVGERSSELLLTHCLGEWLTSCRGELDRIIIDTPSLGTSLDALIIASHSDAMIMVVRDQQTTRQQLARAMRHLGHLRERLIGAVINGVRHSEHRDAR